MDGTDSKHNKQINYIILQKSITAMGKESTEQNKSNVCGGGQCRVVATSSIPWKMVYNDALPSVHTHHQTHSYTMQQKSVVRYKLTASQKGWVTAPDQTVGKREIYLLSNISSDPTAFQLRRPISVAFCPAYLDPNGWWQDGGLQMFYIGLRLFLGHSGSSTRP